MRKNFALILVALMALTLVLAAFGCGQPATENTTSTEAPPPATETMPADTTAMDTTAMDAPH